MHLPFLQEILVILVFSVVVVLLLQQVRLPSILGFLITGVLIGPNGLSLIQAVEEVEVISEIGVIMLLFVIGMELSIKQLISIRKMVFIGGSLQVGLTIGVVALLSRLLDFSWSQAVFAGFLFSLSSTAIVLKILQERNEIAAPHGRNALAILIFQDLIVVPMMLLTPILGGQTDNVAGAVLGLVLKSVLVLVLTIVSARYLVPRFMYQIAKTKSKELFLLSTIAICFAVAYATSEAGLSLALGAFLAGLIISESEYSHQATSIILPFRELFTSFFFISVGMLLDLGFFVAHFGPVVTMALVVLLLKSAVAFLAARVLKYSVRISLLTGLALFQVGEFAFILSKVGLRYDLLSAEQNQYFLSVSILTMLFTPFVMMYSEKVANWFGPGRKASAARKRQSKEEIPQQKLENHLIIIGYGINGSNVARAARYASIPYIIVELNAATVRKERSKGEQIVFGDACHEHVLEAVGLLHARAVVIAISDPQATKLIISNIRQLSQTVYLIVRTRYVKEINELLAMGADEVIPEEFETSVEIFSRVLHNFLVPVDEMEQLVETIRKDNYELFALKENRNPKTIRLSATPELKVTCLRVLADSGPIVRRSIAEAGIRKNYKVSIVAIAQDGKIRYNIHPDDQLKQNDLVYVIGELADIDRFHQLIR